MQLRPVLFAALALAVRPSFAAAPDTPADMTLPQFQGVSCLGTGALGGLIAYAYTDVLVLTGTVVVNPLAIVAPAVATGFAVGCSIGANAAPGIYWLSTKFR